MHFVSLNEFSFIELPASWTYQHEEKFRAQNPDKTIGLAVTSAVKENVPDVKSEFESFAAKWFKTFDQTYTSASEIMSHSNMLGKFYNCGNALEFHALVYIQPVTTNYCLVTFVFRSIRNLENSDFATFEAITTSLRFKVANSPK